MADPKRVALVCDWITGPGGAERVVLELHKMFPDAPIYTSQYDPSKVDWFDGLDIQTGWLQKLPSSLKKFLPVLRALYFSRLDLSSYDLIISSSGAEAKFVKRRLTATHVSYIHAPTHYYWSRYDEYIKNPGFGRLDSLARLGLKLLVGPMRRWDYRSAQRPDHILANSTHIQKEIKKYYRRESTVVFPPVDIKRFESLAKNTERNGFVCVGRLAPYKRIDLAVQACTDLSVPLVVLGGGPDLKRLQKLAGPTITFIPRPNDKDINEALKNAEAFLFPGLDDFGIAPVEALSAGIPVIAYKAGGALDYVQDGKNGLFFEKQTVGSLKNTIKNFKVTYSSNKISESAQPFSEENFAKRIKIYIKENV